MSRARASVLYRCRASSCLTPWGPSLLGRLRAIAWNQMEVTAAMVLRSVRSHQTLRRRLSCPLVRSFHVSHWESSTESSPRALPRLWFPIRSGLYERRVVHDVYCSRAQLKRSVSRFMTLTQWALLVETETLTITRRLGPFSYWYADFTSVKHNSSTCYNIRIKGYATRVW